MRTLLHEVNSGVEHSRSEFDEFPVRFRTVHGYRRAYRMAGSGPALLLIHGIGDSSRTWLPVLGRLARHFTVIAPDLLGHGESDKPRADYAVGAYACGMRDLLTILDVERVTVVGHSLGGGVAMQFAYQFPERCERLILVATGGIGRAVHPVFRLAAMPGAELVLPLTTSAPLRLLARTLAPALGGLGLGSLGLGGDLGYVVERYESLADGTARGAFLRTLRSVVDWRGQVVTMMDRCYLTEGMPTLLVWGDCDGVVPSAHALTAHAAMPGSRMAIFGGAGHFPHQADPARFAELVCSFHASTAPAAFDMGSWRQKLRAGATDPHAPIDEASAQWRESSGA
jgi:pimeloyl-ACP methyl ester carboxylesterase